MGTDLNASLSISGSSGAQTGDVRHGDFIVGGSGGANKPNLIVIVAIAIGVIAALGFLAWLLKRK